MSDLAINEDGEVYIDAAGDLAFATGRDAFEQKIQVSLMSLNQRVIGEENRETAKELVKLSAHRVAESMDELDRVANITAEFSEDDPNTMELTIIYDTGEVLTFETN